MPTYDYVCTSCGHEMEVRHSVHGHGPDACPLCGAPLKKAFGVPTVHFKGTGWARKERSSTAKPAKVGPKETGSGAASDAGGGSGESAGESSGESSGAAAQKDSD